MYKYYTVQWPYRPKPVTLFCKCIQIQMHITETHTHRSLMYFTSKSWQFFDDIHTPPGSNSISLPPYQLLNILRSIPPPPPSPPRDQCCYHFCQSQFPSAFVIPTHIYELSIAVSGCKITDVLWGRIGWDYLGLSINAYSLSSSFLFLYLPLSRSCATTPS